MGYGEMAALTGTVVIIYLIVLALEIMGTIFAYIALTHSIKKRIVRGEDFSAGSVFLWLLGWGCAGAYSGGIATLIYFFVKRQEINATKLQCSQAMNNIRGANANQYSANQQ